MKRDGMPSQLWVGGDNNSGRWGNNNSGFSILSPYFCNLLFCRKHVIIFCYNQKNYLLKVCFTFLLLVAVSYLANSEMHYGILVC